MQRTLKANLTPTTKSVRKTIRGAVVASLTMALLSVNSLAGSTGRDESLAFAGSVSVNGVVMVNRQPAVEAQTLFGAIEIETAANSDSTVVLRNSARIYVSADTRLTVDSSERRLISSLLSGRLLVSVPAGVFLDLRTPDASFKKRSVDEPVTFAVHANECGGTRLEIITGQIEAHNNGDAHIVDSGKSLSTAPPTGGPQITQNSLSKKKKLGIIFGIGGAVAILLAVALANRDEDRQNPGDFGGCVTILSPGVTGCS